MTTTTVDLQITDLLNCTKCIRKAETILCWFDGVELLDVDSKNGKFTIKTSRNPEEIRAALQRKFPGKSVFLSNRRINHSNPPSAFHDMAEALIAISRANGAQSVEFTQSSNIIINFNNQPTTFGTARNAPRPPPPQQQHQQQQQYQLTTSGSAWADGYGGAGNEDFGDPPVVDPHIF